MTLGNLRLGRVLGGVAWLALLVLPAATACADDSEDPGTPSAGAAGESSAGASADAGGGGAGGTNAGGADAGDAGRGGGEAGAALGGAGGQPVVAELQVNLPADLASASAADYADNEHGVISGATLDRWLEDWEGNRPAGITGRLILLQQDSKAGATLFVKHDDEHVFTYGFAQHAYADSQRRNNGLLDTFATIPDGEKTDEILNELGIDLTKDLVVFLFVDKDAVPGTAVDAGSKASKVWYNTRSWWWLRYWGAAAEHLAILDGAAADVLAEENLVDAPSEPPATPGTFSVKQLRVDNTSLKIDVGELIDVVASEDDGYVLVDPRRKAEYFGEAFASPANPVNGKRPLTEGRIKGARFLPWQATLEGITIAGAPGYAPEGLDAAVTTHALRFKSKAALRALYDDDASVNYDAAPEGAVTVHYCGHGRRASTWAFVSLGVLGIPARLYDGSWVEWGNLAGGTALEGFPARPLPEGSPWRTDLATLSEQGSFEAPIAGVAYNLLSGVVSEVTVEASAAGLNIDPQATTTSLLIDADKAYKTE